MELQLQDQQRVRGRIVRHEKIKVKVKEELKESVRPEQFDEIVSRPYSSKDRVDWLIGMMAFTVYLFLYPAIALGIKLSSRGPVLFKQPRTGKNGRVFHCYKFRTMHLVQHTSKNGKPVVTKKGDNRIFAFGQFLRKMNLDELPQIINVLKGEMSLVGPRPYPVQECAYWNETFDDHYYRYSLKPGITGFAQAKGFRGGTLNDNLMRKRLDYDLIYVEKNNLKMDLKIIWMTVTCMLAFKTNAH